MVLLKLLKYLLKKNVFEGLNHHKENKIKKNLNNNI